MKTRKWTLSSRCLHVSTALTALTPTSQCSPKRRKSPQRRRLRRLRRLKPKKRQKKSLQRKRLKRTKRNPKPKRQTLRSLPSRLTVSPLRLPSPRRKRIPTSRCSRVQRARYAALTQEPARLTLKSTMKDMKISLLQTEIWTIPFISRSLSRSLSSTADRIRLKHASVRPRLKDLRELPRSAQRDRLRLPYPRKSPLPTLPHYLR